MSGIAQNAPILEEEGVRDLPRRRRTPSKYAESIKQLAKVFLNQSQMSHKPSKKEKISSSNDEESSNCLHQSGNNGNTLTCILPGTNKKLRLSVIIKKTLKPKFVKKVSKPMMEKEKPKEPVKGKSLLDTLLEACEQIKEDDNSKENKERKGGELANNS